jgi:hypothetical protein
MFDVEELDPVLREAVLKYRHYGQELARLELAAFKSNADDDYEKLHAAVAQRNLWQGKVRDLIKGREKELGWVLIG